MKGREQSNRMPRVLIIEDDPESRRALAGLFASKNPRQRDRSLFAELHV
jgi:hypothetical protein